MADNLRDAEPVYSSETPHFDALFARYNVGSECVSLLARSPLPAALGLQ